MSEASHDLSSFNTFGVAAHAGALTYLSDLAQLAETHFDSRKDLVLGDGSNVLLTTDVPGTVMLNRLSGRRVLGEDGNTVRVWLGAGEPWHDAVRWTLERGFCGLENLSLIPGRCGAAPMQNIGAYGVELADRLVAVDTWDWDAGEPRRRAREECDFTYRDSRFRSGEPDRFLITGLELELDRRFRPELAYAGLREELETFGVTEPTAVDVSDAVIRLRRRKLPDPQEIGNAGSFFKNPELGTAEANRLAQNWPALPLHPVGQNLVKASAAWMIESCGWKGRRDGDAGISDRHALVLVNHGRATGPELRALARRVQDDVQRTFGVRLEPEPRLIEFTLAANLRGG
jgi:UDP-N-acetylmuramate dehydrogenase